MREEPRIYTEGEADCDHCGCYLPDVIPGYEPDGKQAYCPGCTQLRRRMASRQEMQGLLKVSLIHVDPRRLKLGAHFDHVDYCWRPYEERRPSHQEDYDRLAINLQAAGKMTNPLIIFQGCVLIGMRRCEIAIDLGWPLVPCWDIQEDITNDPKPDRVLRLRDEAYKRVDY